jgi:hypothetical protein
VQCEGHVDVLLVVHLTGPLEAPGRSVFQSETPRAFGMVGCRSNPNHPAAPSSAFAAGLLPNRKAEKFAITGRPLAFLPLAAPLARIGSVSAQLLRNYF